VNMTAVAQAATEPRRLFPTIAEAARGLACDGALIDGEAVVLRKDGRSDFRALLTKRGGAQASLKT
jgi:bifunctional non-homologous end joining protein LigD